MPRSKISFFPLKKRSDITTRVNAHYVLYTWRTRVTRHIVYFSLGARSVFSAESDINNEWTAFFDDTCMHTVNKVRYFPSLDPLNP
mmetsp:Transcript_62147/g.92145  ORF Transcript_62147/g.92145 Transcript_62147/m.92145 type:complete len:86 (+) Transcript_62147:719-976(+)